MRLRRSSASSASSRMTRLRDSSAALTSNDGFSVVAPSSVTVAFSTCGSTASCWPLLKRWISSMKRMVRLSPSRRRSRARSTTLRRSATPALVALTASKVALVAPAISAASVVLPLPGGPQRMSDGTSPASTARRSTVPAPMARCWPTNSSNVRGRIRVASGACAAASVGFRLRWPGAAPKSELCPATGETSLSCWTAVR